MLNELRKLVITQKTAALPIDPPTPELAELHSALTHYDQVVSQAVIQAIQGMRFIFPTAQIKTLRDQLDRIFATAGSEREVELYLRYRQRLDQMSDLAEQAARDQPEQDG
jgi:hypothetical protein